MLVPSLKTLLFLLAVCWLGWYLMRTLMLWRYKRRGLAHHRVRSSSEENSRKPLPSQEEALDELTRNVLGASLRRSNPLVTLEGFWGGGKSFIAQELIERLSQLNKKSTSDLPHEWQRVACVHIDIWREQSEIDLHLEVIENILSEPTVFELGKEYYPAARILGRQLVAGLTRIFNPKVALKYEGIEAQILMQRSALPMVAQNDFEGIIGGLRSKGLLVVVILDELDRATPAVAQAALALSQRALHLPGLQVIMPFVRSQFRQKIFNPLFTSSHDLYSTFLAELAQHSHERQIDLSRNQGRKKTAGTLDYSPGEPSPWRRPSDLSALVGEKKGSASAGQSEEQEKDKRLEADEGFGVGKNIANWRAARWLGYEDQLLYYFHQRNPWEREQIYEKAEEKYLSATVQIRPLSTKDVFALIANSPYLKNSLPGFLETLGPLTTDLLAKALKEAIRASIADDLRSRGLDPGDIHKYSRAPTIRHFLAELSNRLEIARATGMDSLKRELLTIFSDKVKIEDSSEPGRGPTEIDWALSSILLSQAWVIAGRLN